MCAIVVAATAVTLRDTAGATPEEISSREGKFFSGRVKVN
jgi:hypothetical protein